MADSDASFRQAKAFLMQTNAEGNSVYDHLYNLVYTMMEENPGDVVNHPEKLRDLSATLKKHMFKPGGVTTSSASANHIPAVHVTKAQQNRKLFDRPAPEVKTIIEQPTPFTTVTTTTVVPPSAPKFKSLIAESQYWRFCGAGLPEQELFLLDLSISRLAAENKLEDVRFFGKIFGTHGNYIVVSSKRYVDSNEMIYQEVNNMPKPPRKKVEVDVQGEPGFKGCNRLSFWVASDASSPWTLLPDVTPQQINAARKINKLFTGNLDAPVISYPAFPWAERTYLRAQLSRILSATYVSPNNALERVEVEEEEEEEEEEGKPRKLKPAKYHPLTKPNAEYAGDEEGGVQTLADTEQWVHAEDHIYETGRQTKVPPKPEVEGEEEPPEEEEEEEAEKKEEEERELFQPIKKDALFAVIKLPKEPNAEDEEGEAEPAAEEGEEGEKEEEEEARENDDDIPDDDPLRKKIYPWNTVVTNNVYRKHGVVAVRSLRWPGALAYAAQGGKVWGCVYLGHGLKKSDHNFTPTPAPPIMKEIDEILEVHDPSAANEKLVLRGEEPKEADSEDDKDEEEEEAME